MELEILYPHIDITLFDTYYESLKIEEQNYITVVALACQLHGNCLQCHTS